MLDQRDWPEGEIRVLPAPGGALGADPGPAPDAVFLAAKRGFDIAGSVAGLPLVALLALVLLALNPRRNPGPLIFRQRRMGRGGRPFTALKFRTMTCGADAARGPDDALDSARITPLGQWLRRSRLDETPQFVNVLRGEMSLVGPRPDIYEHALEYCRTVPGYRARHAVRPGISGLAQVRMGYAEGADMTRAKTRKDHVYLRRMGWRMEVHVILRTLFVMRTGFGAK